MNINYSLENKKRKSNKEKKTNKNHQTLTIDSFISSNWYLFIINVYLSLKSCAALTNRSSSSDWFSLSGSFSENMQWYLKQKMTNNTFEVTHSTMWTKRGIMSLEWTKSKKHELPYQPFDSFFFTSEWAPVIWMKTALLINLQLILESSIEMI